MFWSHMHEAHNSGCPPLRQPKPEHFKLPEGGKKEGKMKITADRGGKKGKKKGGKRRKKEKRGKKKILPKFFSSKICEESH